MLDNMGAVERRVYQAYWNDGLLDVFASLGVLTIGLFWILDWVAAAAIVPAWLALLWAPIRRRFIEPRLGLVEFTEDRERRNTRQLKLVLYFGIACLIIGVEVYFLRGRYGIGPSISLIAGLPAFLLALMAVIASVLVATSRFIAYSVMLVISGIVGALAGSEQMNAYSFAAVGGVLGFLAGWIWQSRTDSAEQ